MVKPSPEPPQAAALAGLAEWDPNSRRRVFLTFCLLPALVVLALVVVYQLLYTVILSFSDASIYHVLDWRLVGFKQYLLVFSEPTFWTTFSKTVLWTLASTGLQIALGVSLAVVLNQQFIAGQSAWRVLLLLPWAMPQYITALTWRGLFQGESGPVNRFLGAVFGLAPIDWLNSPFEAFTAAVLVNVWMGFPFMLVVALAGLRAIPATVYEAARLEGASHWLQFVRLTAPLLRPFMLPATTLGIVWNFNNLNAIWLFSDGGEPADSTHILVSYVYKSAFTDYRFGWSAALSVVIFLILFLFVQAFLQTARWRR
jgi:arabinogalactan oligomer/maltooligosaccharide transport system permease protein